MTHRRRLPTLPKLILAVTLLFMAVTALADPRYGGDFLAGRHYERAMYEATRPGDAGGIFLRTFGDARETVRRMAATGKFAEIVVHMAPFDNSHTYQVSKTLPQIRKDAQWLRVNVAQRYSGTTLMLSPWCEHNHPAATSRPVFDELRRICPECLMVNSVWRGQQVPGTITEIHLTSSKSLPRKPQGEYTLSFDGFGGDGSGDMPDADVPAILARYGDARHVRYWNFRNNRKYGHLDTTPITQRMADPDAAYLKGHRAMMKAREGIAAWPAAKGLYKPFADDHGGGAATKDNKAMCILPAVAKPSVKVFDRNGKQIDVMTRVMPDHTGEPRGPRYYSAKSAYQLGDLAAAGTGSRLLRIDGMPLTDADLRSGRFR